MYDDNPGGVDFDSDLTPREKSRLDAVHQRVKTSLAERGIDLGDPRILNSLPAVRLAVLTDGGVDFEAIAEDVSRLPMIAEQARSLEIAMHLRDGTGAIHEELARMNKHQRLTFGHELEKAKAAVAPAPGKQLSAEDEAAKIALLLEIRDPATRLSTARAWGLV